MQEVNTQALALYLDDREKRGRPACQHASMPAPMCVCSVCVSLRKPEEHTHTPGQQASKPSIPQGQPVLPGTGGGELIEMPSVRRPYGSRYDLRTRRRYATTHTSRNAKGEQIPLGEGWIIKGGDGRYDEMIEEWLTETSKPDPKNCPDCGGTGFVTKTLFDDRGAQKCSHPNLR